MQTESTKETCFSLPLSFSFFLFFSVLLFFHYSDTGASGMWELSEFKYLHYLLHKILFQEVIMFCDCLKLKLVVVLDEMFFLFKQKCGLL